MDRKCLVLSIEKLAPQGIFATPEVMDTSDRAFKCDLVGNGFSSPCMCTLLVSVRWCLPALTWKGHLRRIPPTIVPDIAADFSSMAISRNSWINPGAFLAQQMPASAGEHGQPGPEPFHASSERKGYAPVIPSRCTDAEWFRPGTAENIEGSRFDEILVETCDVNALARSYRSG